MEAPERSLLDQADGRANELALIVVLPRDPEKPVAQTVSTSAFSYFYSFIWPYANFSLDQLI